MPSKLGTNLLPHGLLVVELDRPVVALVVREEGGGALVPAQVHLVCRVSNLNLI